MNEKRVESRSCSARRAAWMRAVASLCLVGAASLLIAACSSAGAGGSTSPKEITISDADNGKTIDAARGDTIVLKLGENGTTGYAWTIDLSGGLKAGGDRFAQDPNTEGVVGAGGTHTWTIMVDGSGTQTVMGTYARPFAPSDNPQHFSLTVTVK